MGSEKIEAYIHQRLAELERQKDMQEVAQKGKLSFGIDAATFGRLPAWESLVKRKKQMIKMLWVNACFVSFTAVGWAGNYFEKFDQNWMGAILTWLMVSAVIMLFVVVWSYYSLFYQFRLAEREIRKLIYQDILTQIKKEEKSYV